MVQTVKTNLNLDSDVLDEAMEMTSHSKSTIGQVSSELARKTLVSCAPSPTLAPKLVNGFEVMPANGRVITTELIKKFIAESEFA
jgi:hypothetical protein